MDLNRFNIVVVGAGALGCAVLKRLASEDFASITVVDGDVVTEKNLINQPLYTRDDAIGSVNKADAVSAHLKSTARTVIKSRPLYVGEMRVDDVISGADLVVDLTDNAETRLIINDACIRMNVPLTIASIRGEQGFFYTIYNDMACFNCISRNTRFEDSQGCANVNVAYADGLGKLISEEIKEFLALKRPQGFTSVNLKTGHSSTVSIKKDINCETCSAHSYTHSLDNGLIQLCGDGIKFSLQQGLDIEAVMAKIGGVYLGSAKGSIRVGNASKSVLISEEGDFLFSGYDKEGAKEFIDRALSSLS